jgi:hypothetical protein
MKAVRRRKETGGGMFEIAVCGYLCETRIGNRVVGIARRVYGERSFHGGRN